MFSSMPKTVKNAPASKVAPVVHQSCKFYEILIIYYLASVHSSQDVSQSQRFFQKSDKYDELESIEKDKEIFSTISIEQDIANLDNIGHLGRDGEQFVLEFDECDEQMHSPNIHMPTSTRNETKYESKNNMFKKQPNQVRNYPKPTNIQIHTQPKNFKDFNEEELKNKRMIMDYLKVVKEKSSMWATKLEEVTKEAEYYKTKSIELESAKDKIIEREKIMAMKYGIIFSQNKELISRLTKKKQENEELRTKYNELLVKKEGSSAEGSSSDMLGNRVTNTSHKRDESSPICKRVIPTSYSSSSFITTYNPAEIEAIDKYVEGLKNNDKSSDSDQNSAKKSEDDKQKTPSAIEDEVLQNKFGIDIKG